MFRTARVLATVGVVLALFILNASHGPPVFAGTTFTVDTTDDAPDDDVLDGECADDQGRCTLRAAIMQANASPGPHTIIVPAGVYELTETGAGDDTAATGDLDLLDDVIIEGAGPGDTIIDGVEADRVFHIIGVDTITAEISGVTITNGSVIGEGGGIEVQGGTLVLTNSEVAGNEASGRGGGIHVTLGLIEVTGSFIEGNDAGQQGGGVFVGGGNVATITGSSISGNDAGFDGAGVYVDLGASATIAEAVLESNEAEGDGGGIYALGALTLTESVVSGNTGDDFGGGIFVGETALVHLSEVSDNFAIDGGGIFVEGGAGVEVAGSTIARNEAGANGGGIQNNGGLDVIHSVFFDNHADLNGGGVFTNGEAEILNSTFSGNTAGVNGGAIHNLFNMAVHYVTIADNTAEEEGGGISNAADATVSNTILAGNSPDNCAGEAIVSEGYNLENADTCGLTETGDLLNTDPMLAHLGDNGGPTLTRALIEGSPAIDAADPDCPPPETDQRGFERPVGEACDIGAFEGAVLERIWGDADCDGSVAIGDAVKTARHLIELSVSQTEPCPELGSEVTVNGTERIWGDVDCEGSVVIGDALKIARHLLSLAVSQAPGCPEMGSQVFLEQ